VNDRPRYVPSAQRQKIGHITPSSNTVLEPMTVLMSRELDHCLSHHFARIRVEAITLAGRHTSQFHLAPMLEAAEALADAGVDAIVWNGTSGAWNGIDADREIVSQISDHVGIPATTGTLAQLDVLTELGISDCALAVPYTADVTERIITTFAGEGVTVVSAAMGGVSENRAMAYVGEDRVRELAREADRTEADCVLIFCTGVAGAQLAADLEAELKKPVFDSVAVSLWGGLKLVGIEPRLEGWGSLLAGGALASVAG
jgi:maleate isomerase